MATSAHHVSARPSVFPWESCAYEQPLLEFVADLQAFGIEFHRAPVADLVEAALCEVLLGPVKAEKLTKIIK